jgi:hypothetical protein
VAGSLVLTSLGALLPIAAEYARRERMRGLKWAAWLAMALAFVFTVSIQRTGSASDIDEASRQQLAAAVAIAEKEQGREAARRRPADGRHLYFDSAAEIVQQLLERMSRPVTL